MIRLHLTQMKIQFTHFEMVGVMKIIADLEADDEQYYGVHTTLIIGRHKL